MIGKVKWFDDQLGYGFIEVEGVSDDIFVHWKEIVRMRGRRRLFAGDWIDFILVAGEKGPRAERAWRMPVDAAFPRPTIPA
jgi:CspA family cold shock protein